ncbi:hypothetical protein GCM10010924_39030 [Rhizobium wenxiniae]|nr:hypothetical protein GCM10010924_39030 [Rhizobium wenxiniae]
MLEDQGRADGVDRELCGHGVNGYLLDRLFRPDAIDRQSASGTNYEVKLLIGKLCSMCCDTVLIQEVETISASRKPDDRATGIVTLQGGRQRLANAAACPYDEGAEILAK